MNKKKQFKGLACMPPERRREIARMGGLAASKMGVAYRWTKEEARAAASKGGLVTSANREHMARIGRRGGRLKGTNAEQRREWEASLEAKKYALRAYEEED